MSSIIDSLTAFSISLKDLIVSIISKNGLVSLLSLVIVIFVFVFSYEYLTDGFYIKRFQNKIELFEKLSSIERKKFETDKELQFLHKNLIQELINYEPSKKISLNSAIGFEFAQFPWTGLFKFLTGGFIGILMIFYGIFAKNEDKRLSLIFGAIFYTLVIGGIFSLIPFIWSPWINYLLLPFIPIILILIITKLNK